MYLSQKDLGDYHLIDIESDGLDATVIWCAVIKNLKTQQVWRFKNDGSANIYHELKRFIDEHFKSIWVGHNVISFDIPVINRLCGLSINVDRVVDTLVLSYLYNPALDGGHSLDAYGQKLGLPKIDFQDWSKFSEEMLTYCERDVDLNEKVFWALIKRMNKIGFSEFSCEIEHKIRKIIDVQQSNGFYFNRLGAESLYNDLRERESRMADQIHGLFPPTLEEVGRYKFRRLKNGGNFASYERHLQQYEALTHNDDGTYSVFQREAFNIGSPKQRVERLLSLGWEPKTFTPKGFPKVDEDSLVAFSEASNRDEIKAMADWLVFNGRANMVGTWLKYVKEDSRIHGKVLSCGATTRRMVHSAPNSANIPSAAKARFGHECRALWGVTPGLNRVLMGYDAAGLETVGLLHYLNNPKATEILLRPKPDDVHTANSRALTAVLGRDIDREWGAKTSWYAWLYGAYPAKLGSIVKGPPSDGEIIIETFFKNVPGLKKLINETQDEWSNNNGLIRTVDGGFVRCPSKGASLNYRIQSLGAIEMKLTAIHLDETSKKEGLEHMKVGDIHDEGQHETDEKTAPVLGKLAVQSIKNAGEQLNLKVEAGGDFKIGTDWSMTH